MKKTQLKPAVHARNLFHASVVMYDAWAVYDDDASPFFLGNTWGEYSCPFDGIPLPIDGDIVAAQEKAMSYAMYRLLWARYSAFNIPPYVTMIQGYINTQMNSLGYDPSITSTDYSDGDPAKLGNYLAAKMQEFGLQDGSNEQNNFANQFYQSINGTTSPYFAGSQNVEDPNRWQPINAVGCMDDNMNYVNCGFTPPAITAEWGNVLPFSLTESQAAFKEHEGNAYKLYLDPGDPPYLDTTVQTGLYNDFYKWGYVMNIIWQSHHNNDDGVMIDISPNGIGGTNFTDITQLPQLFEDYQNYYNLLAGGVNDPGHALNPVTGLPYEPQVVPRKDYTRVLSQYWADSLSSVSISGRWYKLANYVAYHPSFEKKWEGQGEVLSDLEWDVRAYFALGGGMHDADIACWGTKGAYDYTRPIMAIRWMGTKGQSSDENLPSYHPAGLPLIPGYIELVESGDPLAGTFDENVNKIKIFSWRGPQDVTFHDGTGWLLAENWWSYQFPNSGTTNFPGYYSDASAISRTSAEILTRITGSEYFPGGIFEHHAMANSFLEADEGPSVDITLQWATFRDASDQCGLSRIYGGLHPPQDDIPGRKVGLIIGPQAFEKANSLMSQDLPRVIEIAMSDFTLIDQFTGSNYSVTFTFDEAMNTSVVPTISFVGANATASLIDGAGSWLDSLSYQIVYAFVDANETIDNLQFQITVAEDVDGNANIPGISLPVWIDTENPDVTQLSNENNIVVVNDESAASGQQLSLLLTFSEPMYTSEPAIVTINEVANNGTFIQNNAASNWVDSNHFLVVFDIADNNTEWSVQGLIDVEAQDENLNLLELSGNDLNIIVDTQNPSVMNFSTNVSNINDNSAGSEYTATFTYDEDMNTTVQPNVSFTSDALETSLVYLAVNSGWQNTNTFSCTYYIADANVEINNIAINAIEAIDFYGNTQLAYVSGDALNIDTKNPTVTGIVTSNNTLADADVTVAFTLSISFDDEMDNTVAPLIIFGNGDPLANSLNFISGSWSGDIYTATFDLSDANEEISEIEITTVDAVDNAGNPQQLSFTAYNSFRIDTKNPQLVGLAANTYNVTSNFNATGFHILSMFDEPMDENVTPNLSFPVENPTALTYNGGSWLNSTTYQTNYTVQTSLSSLADIDVDVAGNATDIAGNNGTITSYIDFFSINVVVNMHEVSSENPIVVYPNPVGSGNVNIEMDHIPTNLYIEIYNSTGQLIQAIGEKDLAGNKVVVSTENLSNGMYIVRVNSDQERSVFNVSIAK